MLTELLSGAVVYVVTGYTDMRKGIDDLAQIVEGTLKCDIYSKAVYLFCGRNLLTISENAASSCFFNFLIKGSFNVRPPVLKALLCIITKKA